MKTAKLLINGRNQSVCLPKDCQFEGTDVFVKKYEGMVILFSKDSPWSPLWNSLDHFSEDFMSERKQPDEQKRDDL